MRTTHVIVTALLLITGATVGVLAQEGENVSQPASANDTNATNTTRSPDDAGEAEDDEGEEADRITVCHVPPGNPDARHTIEIGAPAWQAHEGHGDHEGPCEGDAGDEPDENETAPEQADDENEAESQNESGDESDENQTEGNESED